MRELSKKSKWWIPKERYLELKHFCRQYDDWRKATDDLDTSGVRSNYLIDATKKGRFPKSDVEKITFAKIYYNEKIRSVYNCAQKACNDLADYILLSVTKGYTYTYLRMKFSIPCSQNVYYDNLRKFYWILDKVR